MTTGGGWNLTLGLDYCLPRHSICAAWLLWTCSPGERREKSTNVIVVRSFLRDRVAPLVGLGGYMRVYEWDYDVLDVRRCNTCIDIFIVLSCA